VEVDGVEVDGVEDWEEGGGVVYRNFPAVAVETLLWWQVQPVFTQPFPPISRGERVFYVKPPYSPHRRAPK
jgi:hypothetical protein